MLGHRTQSVVLVDLPRTGLGNKLFVWARGLVFAHLAELPLIISPWEQMSIGSFLRKSNRFYFRQLQSTRLLDYIYLKSILRFLEQEREPSFAFNKTQLVTSPKAFIFTDVPHWSDPFKDIKQHRNFIRDNLWSIIQPQYRRQIDALAPPVIAIHIRRGDFRELQANEDFARVGSTRTPLIYFRQLILQIRKYCGPSTAITIFSDGTESAFKEIFEIPNVHLSPRRPAIVDLMLMSKSKLIVGSAGSTFSYWAGFLSDAAFIHHPDHFHTTNRNVEINEHAFEGPTSEYAEHWPELLLKNLAEIN